jgi:hypothetical protein
MQGNGRTATVMGAACTPPTHTDPDMSGFGSVSGKPT